ncbi:hypothetical protein ABK040_008271 [Willaertia magna]
MSQKEDERMQQLILNKLQHFINDSEKQEEIKLQLKQYILTQIEKNKPIDIHHNELFIQQMILKLFTK